jgi:putative ABC transport system permease protein
MQQIIIYNLQIALNAIRQNVLRSILTSLGIVFGVSSVISMLAIGRGAEQEILEQMKLLGTNNIIIEAVTVQMEGDVDSSPFKGKEKQAYSPGLGMADLYQIRELVPSIVASSPEMVEETVFIRGGKSRSGKMLGVDAAYFDINKMGLFSGAYFDDSHLETAAPVCIIGYGLGAKFFPGENPIGKRIKAGPLWLTIIGVLENRTQRIQNAEKLGIRDYNMDVFLPAQSMLVRYKDRNKLTSQDLQKSRSGSSSMVIFGGGMSASSSSSESENSGPSEPNYQINRMIIQVDKSERLSATADVIYRMLKRRHNGVIDFELIIPEQLLEQEQRTKTIFNVVLSSIAGISLVVGGIGIMNIMLASVMERFKEIGVRIAIGARKTDIMLQFLSEALAISLTGGTMGVILGFLLSYIIESTTGIPTIVTGISVVISFVVALAVGLVFGIVPAKKAADFQPADAVRYE